MSGGSSSLRGEWNDVSAVFRFSVAADGRAGCRNDWPPLGRRRRPAPLFLYLAADASWRGDAACAARGRRRVADDQAANRWELSGSAASGRVPRGRALGSSSRIYTQIDHIWRSGSAGKSVEGLLERLG